MRQSSTHAAVNEERCLVAGSASSSRSSEELAELGSPLSFVTVAELVSQISDWLPASDVMKMGTVNRKWREATLVADVAPQKALQHKVEINRLSTRSQERSSKRAFPLVTSMVLLLLSALVVIGIAVFLAAAGCIQGVTHVLVGAVLLVILFASSQLIRGLEISRRNCCISLVHVLLLGMVFGITELWPSPTTQQRSDESAQEEDVPRCEDASLFADYSNSTVATALIVLQVIATGCILVGSIAVIIVSMRRASQEDRLVWHKRQFNAACYRRQLWQKRHRVAVAGK